jgi:hypothetical protein
MVQTPPNWLEKERGIRTRDDDIFLLAVKVITTGIRMATAAVLTRKAESAAVMIQRTNIRRVSPLPASLSMSFATRCTRPVRTSPIPRINIAPIVTVAGLAKPRRPSSGVIRPRVRSATRTHMATRSTLTLPDTKSPKAPSRTSTVNMRSRLSNVYLCFISF